MIRNLQLSYTTENIIEENPFLTILESKVIFKTKYNKTDICLKQISNVRIIKNRDTTINIVVLLSIAFFYFLFKTIFQDLNFVLRCLYVVANLILVILSLSLENFTYKLLINVDNLGFNEIPISKRNVIYAKNFISKLEKTSTLKDVRQKSKSNYKNFEVIS